MNNNNDKKNRLDEAVQNFKRKFEEVKKKEYYLDKTIMNMNMRYNYNYRTV
jgi:hypothetical protein